ncbi:peptide-methionine (S)-S-oxide reductase MsrA [Henriciella mobilis]|uniref:peptide-methionine (S)-S-oxide reductase MsrA n=1 Tax=Henriciella mobilis TaxID=2305467 RepID=UPI000E663C25|nr:peptide-methionine (S)-S-oxide reductase MsrA [Henriciella mobilis]RIJ17809.1 peptide-methionine (S)-S-oxide reductase MsrA [Henriciella mobilis]RIJ25378.1 peptide-methionine (S)-S-oxide reductase MsrA [Henriciella mobilis]
MFFSRKPADMPKKGEALPGRDKPIPTADIHFVNGRPLDAKKPEGFEEIVLGMGCFWGVERIFWQMDGVWLTQVGYAGGETPNPTYEETCTGLTGHTEVVRVIYDPAKAATASILKAFWEGHDPTQGMRQGNDVGTQYRSAIFATTEDQLAAAEASKQTYEKALKAAGRGGITTEIGMLDTFYHAEDYHQQYLAKNPGGYCGIGGTGVSCPMPTGVSA